MLSFGFATKYVRRIRLILYKRETWVVWLGWRDLNLTQHVSNVLSMFCNGLGSERGCACVRFAAKCNRAKLIAEMPHGAGYFPRNKSKHETRVFRNCKLINVAAFHEDTSRIYAPAYFWPTNYKLVHFVRCAVHNRHRSGLCAHERVSRSPCARIVVCDCFGKPELSCRRSPTTIILSLRSRWH